MPQETLGNPEDDSSAVPRSPKTLRYAVSLNTMSLEAWEEDLSVNFAHAEEVKFTLRVLDRSYSFKSARRRSKKFVEWQSWETVEVPYNVVTSEWFYHESDLGENGGSIATANQDFKFEYSKDDIDENGVSKTSTNSSSEWEYSENDIDENGDSNISVSSDACEDENKTMVILEMTKLWSPNLKKSEYITLISEIEAAELFHPCGASCRIVCYKKGEEREWASVVQSVQVFSSPLDDNLKNGLKSLRTYIYNCNSIHKYEATFLHADGKETAQISNCYHDGIVYFQAQNVSGLRITNGGYSVPIHLKDIKHTTIPSWQGDNYVSAYCPFSVCEIALNKLERLGKIFVQVQPRLKMLDKTVMTNVSSRDAALETLSSTEGMIEFASEEDKSEFLDALESDGMGGVDAEALIQLLDDLGAASASDVPPETREDSLKRILMRLLLAVLLPNPERRTQETERVLVKRFVNEQCRARSQADLATQLTMPDLNHELRSFKKSLRENLDHLVALHEAIHVPESSFDIMYMRDFGDVSNNSMETKLLQAARRSDFETCKRILQTHPEIDPLCARGPSTEEELGVFQRNAANTEYDTESYTDKLQEKPRSPLDYLIAAIARIRTECTVFDLTENSRDKEMSRWFTAAKRQELQSARDVVALLLERRRHIGESAHSFAQALRSFDVKTLQLMVRNEETCRRVNRENAWRFVFSNWRAHSNICSELTEVLLDVEVANVSRQALTCSESGVFHCQGERNTLYALFDEQFGDEMTLGILRKMLKTRRRKSDDILISLFSQADNSNNCYNWPLLEACELGYTECVQEFISHGASISVHVSKIGQAALQGAIQNRHTEVLRILCKSDASCINEITPDGRTLLHLAIDMKCPEMVAVLCENGARSDDKALSAAVDVGNVEILQVLSNDRIAVPHRYRGVLDRTLLHLACNKPVVGDDDVVQKLIQMNVAVNEVDMIGRTALHDAAAMGNLSAVRSLLEAGADETLPTRREGSTAIHEAARMGRVSVLQFVLRNSSGETVDAIDMQGRTPLCYAFKRRKFLELSFHCLRELQKFSLHPCLRGIHFGSEMEEFATLIRKRYERFDALFLETIDSREDLCGIGSTRETTELASRINKCLQESKNNELSKEDIQNIEDSPAMEAFVELIKKRLNDLNNSSRSVKEVNSSEVICDLNFRPLIQVFVNLIKWSYEEFSIQNSEQHVEISKGLESIEQSDALQVLTTGIKRRIDMMALPCETANEVRTFILKMQSVSGHYLHLSRDSYSFLSSVDGEILSYFPEDICRNLNLLHRETSEEELQGILRDCFEELFVETRKADAVLGILLDAGADIDHVDDQGNPAFDNDYRIEYFKMREKELRAALEKRGKLAHDQPIFKGKIVHRAVHAAWVQQGFRRIACCALVYWVILLALLTLVAIRYSGCGVYESFSIQQSIVNRMSSGDSGTLEDVKDLDSWNDYVENVFVEAIWPSESDLHVDIDGRRFGEGLVLLGRPRYRQIRTRADSCSTTMPSLLSVVETPCYAPYSQGTFSSLDATIEDRSPHACMLRDVESHVINWEDSPAVSFSGKFGFYKGGGSSVVLLSNKTATQQLLQDLRACEFISMGTRLAALEITLYSRSHELFVHGRVFMEHTTTGGVFANQQWETRKLVSYRSTEDRRQVWIEVLLTLFFLGHFYRELDRLLNFTCRTQNQKTDGASEQVASNGDDNGAMPDFSKVSRVVVFDPEEQQRWMCEFEEDSYRIVSEDNSRSFKLERLKWIKPEVSKSERRRFNVGETVYVHRIDVREYRFGVVVSANEIDERWTYSVNLEAYDGKTYLIQNVPEYAIEMYDSEEVFMELRKNSSTRNPSSDANSRRGERRKFHSRLRGWISDADSRLRGWISGAQRVRQSFRVNGIVRTCEQVLDDLPAYWSDPFNYLDLSIMFLFFLLAVMHIKLIHGAAQRSSDWLENAERDVYIDVSDLMRLSTARQYLLGAVVFLCYLKTLEYLRVAATFAVPVMIIIGMLAKLMSFLAILVVFIFAFGIFDYVVFGLTYAPVNSLVKALVFTFRGALGELDFDGKYEMNQAVGTGMTMLAAVLLVILILNLLIAVMNEAYEDVKATAEARWCYRQYMAIYRGKEKETLSKWVLAKGEKCWCMVVRPLLCQMCKPFRICLGLDSSEKNRPSWAREWPCRSSRISPSEVVDEESQVKSL